MKKLILVLVLVFAGSAYADDLAQKKQQCVDAMNADPAFAKSVLSTVDKQLDQQTIDAHNDAFHHIQKNEKQVIYAYAALWVIAAGFLVFLWRRQQALRSEIAQLRSDLAAAAKENA
jgi:cell division protein FtsL